METQTTLSGEDIIFGQRWFTVEAPNLFSLTYKAVYDFNGTLLKNVKISNPGIKSLSSDVTNFSTEVKEGNIIANWKKENTIYSLTINQTVLDGIETVTLTLLISVVQTLPMNTRTIDPTTPTEVIIFDKLPYKITLSRTIRKFVLYCGSDPCPSSLNELQYTDILIIENVGEFTYRIGSEYNRCPDYRNYVFFYGSDRVTSTNSTLSGASFSIIANSNGGDDIPIITITVFNSSQSQSRKIIIDNSDIENSIKKCQENTNVTITIGPWIDNLSIFTNPRTRMWTNNKCFS